MSATYVLLCTTRDEGGRWLYEQLQSGVHVAFFRRRPGQSRHPVTLAELQAAMGPTEPAPDYSRPEPASTWAHPLYGPRS